MKKTYVSGNLSRKRFWNTYYKKKHYNIAIACTNYWIQNKGTNREYIKCTSSGKRDNNINEAKYLRRLSNKRIRKMKPEQLETFNYSKYKRVFDYWWELY